MKALALAGIFLGSHLLAVPITYTFDGVADGSLGASVFTARSLQSRFSPTRMRSRILLVFPSSLPPAPRQLSSRFPARDRVRSLRVCRFTSISLAENSD